MDYELPQCCDEHHYGAKAAGEEHDRIMTEVVGPLVEALEFTHGLASEHLEVSFRLAPGDPAIIETALRMQAASAALASAKKAMEG